jgi:hypothetical protein
MTYRSFQVHVSKSSTSKFTVRHYLRQIKRIRYLQINKTIFKLHTSLNCYALDRKWNEVRTILSHSDVLVSRSKSSPGIYSRMKSFQLWRLLIVSSPSMLKHWIFLFVKCRLKKMKCLNAVYCLQLIRWLIGNESFKRNKSRKKVQTHALPSIFLRNQKLFLSDWSRHRFYRSGETICRRFQYRSQWVSVDKIPDPTKKNLIARMDNGVYTQAIENTSRYFLLLVLFTLDTLQYVTYNMVILFSIYS